MLGSLWFNSFSAGGAVVSDYELISTTSVGTAVAQIDLDVSGLTQYKHLQIRGVVRDTRGGYSSSILYARFNTDTGSNYSAHNLTGSGSSVSSGGGGPTAYPTVAQIPGATGTSNAFNGFVLDILDAYSTSKNKTFRAIGGMAQSYNSVDLTSGAWYNTAALTSVRLFGVGNIEVGSRFSIYGLKG